MDFKRIKIIELWGVSNGFKRFVKISSNSEVESSEAYKYLRKLYCYLISQFFFVKNCRQLFQILPLGTGIISLLLCSSDKY